MPRLYWRIYLHFLGVLLVVGLAASVVFAVGQRGAFQRQLADRVSRHVGTLVGEAFPDPGEIGRRLRRLHDDFEVDVTVRDLSGGVVAAAGTELRPLSDAERAALRDGHLVTRAAPVWFVAAPVRAPASGAVVAFVEVSLPRRLRAAGAWRPGLAVALVLLIVAVAAAPLARRISRPVERLTEAARRLGQGELAYRVPVAPPGSRPWGHRARRPDELRELTRAFNDMAERVERLVGGQKELLANVSHELRSPLARIRVALALLPREGESEARLRDVEADLAELDRLIEAVLTTARLEATGVPADLGPVDVGRLLEEVAERAGHDPVTAGTTVRIAPGPAPALVADGALLKRALWNLVENAAKYGAPPVTLAATREGERVVLAVADEGEGIPPAERARVLEPFYRRDRARTPSAAGEPSRGVGLGLTLARRIAEVHGGSVRIGPAAVLDGRERGCRVALVLPAGGPRAAAADDSPAGAAGGPSAGAGGGPPTGAAGGSPTGSAGSSPAGSAA
jgi:two-component system OmpR family sensor kinase